MVFKSVIIVQNKFPFVYYISRDIYNDLAATGNGPEKVFELVQGNYKNKDVSGLTHGVAFSVNALVHKTLLNTDSHPVACSDSFPYHVNINKDEEKYVSESAKGYLISNNTNSCPGVSYRSNDEDVKCFEIIPHATTDELFLIVVVDVGFLTVVTETKETLLQHFLSILRHCYDNKAFTGFFVHEYLGLKLSDGNFNLVLNRLNRH